MMTAEINNSRSKLLMFWSSCSVNSFFSFLFFLVNGFVPRLHALSYELTTCVFAPSAGHERTMFFSGSNLITIWKSDEAS